MVALKKTIEIMTKISEDLASREEELCKLDSFVGDGDHGTTVRKTFLNIKEALSEETPEDISTMFITCAMVASDVMGGAIGPIFSSLFMGLSSGCQGKSEIETDDLYEMFRCGLEKVQGLGGARVGDKTLVDSLSPTVDALREARGMSEKKAMALAAKRAYLGAIGTAELVSLKGRSHFLGESSKGYIDAGSMTMYYFIKGFADAL